MGRLITDPNKLSQGTKDKISKACNKGIKVKFSQWYKPFQYEKSPTGSSMTEITIDTKKFDRNPFLVAEELIRMRRHYSKLNKEYMPPSNLEELKEVKKNNKIKETKELMEQLENHINNKKNEIIKNPTLKGLARYGIEQLPDIDIFQSKDGASTLSVMGSGQTGKTFLMRHIMNKMYDNTDWISVLYTLSPHIKLFEGLKEIKIRPAFNKCDEYLIEMMKDINMETDNKYRFMNFFDDILEEGTKHKQIIDRLCLIYRNSLLSTWLSTQYPKLINKKNRSNINSFILFRFHQFDYLEEVIKSYLKPYFMDILGSRNMDEMIDLYHAATEDHGFIYVSPFQNQITFHRLKL